MKRVEADGVQVVDVVGSFLYKKYKKLAESSKQVFLPPLPPPPVSGWIVITGENCHSLAGSIPCDSQVISSVLIAHKVFYFHFIHTTNRFDIYILSWACWPCWKPGSISCTIPWLHAVGIW